MVDFFVACQQLTQGQQIYWIFSLSTNNKLLGLQKYQVLGVNPPLLSQLIYYYNMLKIAKNQSLYEIFLQVQVLQELHSSQKTLHPHSHSRVRQNILKVIIGFTHPLTLIKISLGAFCTSKIMSSHKYHLSLKIIDSLKVRPKSLKALLLAKTLKTKV